MRNTLTKLREGLRLYSVRLSFVPAFAAAVAMIDPGVLISVYALLPIDPVVRAVMAVASFTVVLCAIWAARFWPQDIETSEEKTDGDA